MSASGSSRRWSGRTRWRCCSPVRRCTCSICGRWARKSGAASRSSPGTRRCAPTCSPSAQARSSAKTRSSLLPGARGPDPDRSGHPRPGRFHRREDHARHRHVDGRRGAARSRLRAAHAGQAVPDGERWHGSPAQRTEVDYLGLCRLVAARCAGPASAPSPCSSCSSCTCRWRRRRVACCWPGRRRCQRCWVRACCSHVRRFTSTRLIVSLVLFFGAILAGLLLVVTVPRVLNPVHQAGHGLSPVRFPLLGPPGDRAHDQHKVLHVSVR